ncbi:Oidioi.mRNA.OKI2018_I69.chr1.g249.t2.cds [Oikopleura dioica]|uniref:Oidioi.mRNA.OKI2018_I69.chr1.g249.t2.cds n=1 Tax=Oikopleura dioica TaxID=34765 RepID=A0ABN7SPG2_OIKDI|nr:Oidioi.mRNA.OKI2018_I69.chr1.g249.t2.cds [Oikopleura dioica]
MVHAVKRYCFCQRCCLRRTQCMVAQMDKALEERDPKMRRGPRQTFSFKCFHIRIKLRSRRKNSRTGEPKFELKNIFRNNREAQA